MEFHTVTFVLDLLLAICTTQGLPYTTSNYRSCGGVLTSSSGYISSPNYPSYYYNNEFCVWQIHVPSGQRIIFTITSIELEQNCCRCDNVAVYDGQSINSALLASFCQGNGTGRPIRSSSNYLTVLFKTDGSVTSRGFRAVYNTGQESCRYNCGNSFRNCSCSSSCGFDCCPDFCDYCSYTNYGYCYGINPTVPIPTQPDTSAASCRYSCGYHLGACSCSSSCVWYGNCCPDYYEHCSTATPSYPVYPTTGISSCGGNLYDSGSFFSPNYPNYYYDNAYCVWHINAPTGQSIFLTFNNINLETCCTCDYIAVYDGLSLSYPLLGKICFNSTMGMFHSSSQHLTVLFRTDYSGSGRGFQATYTSSLPESSGKVNCSSDNMNIVLQTSYLNSLGYSGHDLYLNDQFCRPQVYFYQVVFNFPLSACGTRQEFSNGKVVFTNDVRAYRSESGQITRQSNFQLRVGCYMEQDTTAHIMYVANEFPNANITGTGQFNATMAFYTSSNFYYPVLESPYLVTLNQYLYVQVQLQRSYSNVVLFLDTCVASPSQYDFTTRSYDLLRSGCVKDSTVYIYSNGYGTVARFRFQAFKFLRSYPAVYLQCKVVLCQANDFYSRCSQGCHARKVRSLGSADKDTSVILGPIQLKDTKDPEKKAIEKDIIDTKG